MSELPPLAICLVTCNRTEEALETVRSTCWKLGYPEELIGWYIADDGSKPEHHSKILEVLGAYGKRIIGEHNERFRDDDSHNCGKGWNKGLGICHQYSDFVLWLEDDWKLESSLDLKPYVKLLQEREDVGIISFRILSVGADVHTVGYDGRHYLKYLRSTQYAYSGNPLLRHGRFTRHYGWFAEDRNPGDIELELDSRFREKEGPDIWRPVDISPWGGWAHIGTAKTW